MSHFRIAHRYAEAFIRTAEESHVLKNVGEDLAELRRCITGSREFALFLKSPVITKEKKQQTFEAVFGKTVQPLTLQFLFLLIEKGREEVLPEVIEAYFRLQDEASGLVHVQVTSAAELTAQQTAQLVQRFEGFSKKNVRMDVHVDKQLIGGFIARIGDTMFDGSVKRQLERLRERFTEEAAAGV